MSNYHSTRWSGLPRTDRTQEHMIATDLPQGWNEKNIKIKPGIRKVDNGKRTHWQSTRTISDGYSSDTSMDMLPIQIPQTSLTLRRAMSNSSSGSCGDPSILSELMHGNLTQVGAENGGVSPQIEVQRPTSPRSCLNFLQLRNKTSHTNSSTNPMDKFLAHDEMIDSGEYEVPMEEDWRKLRLLREKVVRLRSSTKSKRRELQEIQHAKSSADEEFMKFVRTLHLNSDPRHTCSSFQASENAVLEAHFQALQDVRDNYGPAEYDYNALEDRLDEIEFELAKVEGRLYDARYHRNPKISRLGSDPIPGSTSLHSAPDSLLGVSSDLEDQYHPLQVDYLSRLGDLDLAKERWQNLVFERDRLLMAQESLLPVGMEIKEHEKEFLDEYSGRAAALRGEISEIEEDVERKRTTCLQAGLEITEEASDSMEESTKDDSSISDTAEAAAYKPSLYRGETVESSQSMFPLLIPNSDFARSKFEVLITNFDEANKGDRINSWMLHKLRVSPLEVELLVRVFCQVLDILNFSKWHTGIRAWQFSVLLYWNEDESNKISDAYNLSQAHSSVSAKLSPRGRQHTVHGIAPEPKSAVFKTYRRVKSAP